MRSLLIAGAVAAAAAQGSGNVAVALYSESLCPDCKAFSPTFASVWNTTCVQTMVSTYEEVSYGNAQTSGGVVTCQHGPTECEGNMLEACATEVGGSVLGVEFTTCMFAAIPWASAATQGRKCAVEVGISWAPVDKCFGKGKGAQGVKLIAANAARTAALNPPHTYVPWLVVGGTPIPDPPTGGPAPADVLTAICKAYTGTQPTCCSAPEIAALRHRTEHLSKKDW